MEKQETKKVKVQITEVLQRIVEVDANSISDAYQRVEEMCDNEEICLDWSDFNTRRIEVLPNDK